jgi:nucleoside-diphosphate-sugar epimerase
MRVFVAGGSGTIGRRLVPQLRARGHQVTATTRGQRGTAELVALGATPVVVDGLDGVCVREAVARAEPDAIVHEMTSLSGKPDLRHFDRWFAVTNRLRTEGTNHLLAAAEAAGVGRFVVQSYTGWNNERTGGRVKDESDDLDRAPVRNQAESMAAIRFLERAVLGASLAGAALRYGSLYGPGASELMVALVRKRQLPVIGGGTGVWSWIHVDDAAAATVAALENAARGVFDIVDDEPAEVSKWLPCLAKAVGARLPLEVPSWLGRLAVGQVGVQWMTEARGASNRKAKQELPWRLRFPTWREGFVHGLDAERVDRSSLEALVGPPRGAEGRGARSVSAR